MNFKNTTRHPALAFKGIDQLEQLFHVIVMRQTYTWDETGLLVLSEEQDPLIIADQLADPKNLLSGVVEEADLAHEPPRDCRRLNFLREYDNENTKLYP